MVDKLIFMPQSLSSSKIQTIMTYNHSNIFLIFFIDTYKYLVYKFIMYVLKIQNRNLLLSKYISNEVKHIMIFQIKK